MFYMAIASNKYGILIMEQLNSRRIFFKDVHVNYYALGLLFDPPSNWKMKLAITAHNQQSTKKTATPTDRMIDDVHHQVSQYVFF